MPNSPISLSAANLDDLLVDGGLESGYQLDNEGGLVELPPAVLEGTSAPRSAIQTLVSGLESIDLGDVEHL